MTAMNELLLDANAAPFTKTHQVAVLVLLNIWFSLAWLGQNLHKGHLRANPADQWLTEGCNLSRQALSAVAPLKEFHMKIEF